MNCLRSISFELKKCLRSNLFFKSIFDLDIIFLYSGLTVLWLNLFTGFGNGLGGLLYIISYWTFLLGALLSFANLNLKHTYLGLFSYSLLQWIIFFKFISELNFDISIAIKAAVFAWVGYVIYCSANKKVEITKREVEPIDKQGLY